MRTVLVDWLVDVAEEFRMWPGAWGDPFRIPPLQTSLFTCECGLALAQTAPDAATFVRAPSCAPFASVSV